MPRRRVVIDHVTVGVGDLQRSREFYRRALVPLGFAEIGPTPADAHEIEFGLEEAADFAFTESPYSASKVLVRTLNSSMLSGVRTVVQVAGNFATATAVPWGEVLQQQGKAE